MKNIFQISVVFIMLLLSALPVAADALDSEREKLVSENLAGEIKVGEVIWLDAVGEKFLALLKKQTSPQANGAIILLHGMGTHADWPQTISPIRTAMPEHGWTTLSIQLPVIAPRNQIENYGKTLWRAAARINTAISFLHEHNYTNIVVIGHSFGAVSALNYIQYDQEQNISSLVTINLQDYAFLKPAINLSDLIKNLNVPVLDIYGTDDYKAATLLAADRRRAAKKGENDDYEQMEIETANHYFADQKDELVNRILDWVNRTTPDTSQVINNETEVISGGTGDKPGE